MSYIVAYKRDVKTENRKQYGNVHLYDCTKTFEEKTNALTFAYNNLPATMLEKLDGNNITMQETYGVLIHHHGKYNYQDYGGGTTWLHSWDFHRVEKTGIEALIQTEMKKQYAEKVTIGIEHKLF